MIGVEVNRVVYKGDGQVKNFPYSFTISNKDEIIVTVVDPDRNKKELTSDFFIDEDKKEVIYPGYASGEEPAEAERPPTLPGGWLIVLQRKTRIDQQSDLGGKWPFDVTEESLDKITRILQDIDTDAKRHLTLSPETESIDVTLPKPEANKGFYWDETGKKLVSADNPNLAAKNAAESASAASESEKNAAVSESNAYKYKQDAESAQRAAETARDKAKDSAGSAASSAAVATEKRKDIELHEKNAASSAAAAKASEQNAADSKNAAKVSANAAGNSECNAAYSAAVAQKERESAGSYASAASGSASSAATSASTAVSAATSAADSYNKSSTSERNASAFANAASASASNAKSSSDTANEYAQTAKELYKAFCTDIIGPPPSAMNKADMFVAPGPAAMAAMDEGG
uniref:hypothetical protein n=1 Tax=Dialister sp. TaxID=1955814 RepID=UPI0040293E74